MNVGPAEAHGLKRDDRLAEQLGADVVRVAR
jgi:hypothetical protein